MDADLGGKRRKKQNVGELQKQSLKKRHVKRFGI